MGACRLEQVYDNEGNFAPVLAAHLTAALPGEVQIVNRGELYANILVFSRIRHVIGMVTTIYTDSAYCVKGHRQGALKQKGSFNDDLWQLYFEQVERLQSQVVLVKVKAHLKLDDASVGLVLLPQLAGNAFADELAKIAASSAAIPAKVAESVRIAKVQNLKIMQHLMNANLEMVRLLELKGFRDTDKKKPKQVRQPRSSTPAARGHQPRRIRQSK